MPIYEYRCRKCGKVTEVMQKIADPPLRRCPKCSGRVQKLISRTSFQLKGGGWFAEGYGKPAPKQERDAKKGEDKGTGGKEKAEKKAASC